METLARFRRPPAADQIAVELADITNADADHLSLGTVPSSWLTERTMGTAFIESGRFAYVYSAQWLAYLRRNFESELVRSGALRPGEVDFDLALLLSHNRALTQRAATAIYALGFEGIYYQSRHGADLFNWALFEPFHLKDPFNAEIESADSDFQEALRRLDLKFDDLR